MYPYIVKISGRVVGSFNEVSGLTSDTNVIDYREGGPVGTFRKPPKGMGPAHITLTRGVIHDPAFAAWLKQPRIPHLVTIEHVNAAGVTVWSREIKDCAMTATHVTLAPRR